MKKDLTVIGRDVFVEIPMLGEKVPAKVDSGAYTSALHCSEIRKIQKGDKEHLEVTILGHKKSGMEAQDVTFKEFGYTTVISSTSHRVKWPTVELDVVIEGVKLRTTFALCDRSSLKFPILLGRKVLNGNFMINTHISTIKSKSKAIK